MFGTVVRFVRVAHISGLAIGLAVALLSTTAAGQAAWTCTGTASATCSVSLNWPGDRCAPDKQVCVDPGSFSTGIGCRCLTACRSSSDCAGNEQCSSLLGGHCTSAIACNSNAGCENDAVCVNGNCSRPPAACTFDAECSNAAPNCLRGQCVKLQAGQCTTNQDCPGNPCEPQSCDTVANRCVAARGPCADVGQGLCLATSATAFKCVIPACTSNAQCSGNPCDGTPQRCNVATGRCDPGNPPCQGTDESCRNAGGGSFQCTVLLQQPDWERGGVVDRLDPEDFAIDVNVDPPVPVIGPGGRNFVMTAMLPAMGARAGAHPLDVYFAIAKADRGLLVEGTLAGKDGKPDAARWTRDAKTGAWQWKRSGGRSQIDSVKLTPVGGPGGALRVELRGRTFAEAGALSTTRAVYAADLGIKWGGEKPSATRSAAILDRCDSRGVGSKASVSCTGRPLPRS